MSLPTVEFLNWIDSSGADEGYAITTDYLGNVYTTGSIDASFVKIGNSTYTKPYPSSVHQSVYIVKYNATTTGTPAWVRWIDGSGNDQGRGIATDLDGNVYTTGYVGTGQVKINDVIYTKPSNLSNDGAYIIKYNTSGTLSWVQWIDGSGADKGYDIKTDFSGNVYCTGFVSTGSVTISGVTYTKPSDGANAGAFIIKYTTNGKLLWIQWIDGTGIDQGNALSIDRNGNVYATGYVSTGLVSISGQTYQKTVNLPTVGAYVVKYNTNGQLLWVRWIDSTSVDEGNGIANDSEGNVYCTGHTEYNLIVNGITYTHPTSTTVTVTKAAYIIKYNTNGDLMWINWIDGSLIENGGDITTDGIGNIYVTGNIRSNNIVIKGYLANNTLIHSSTRTKADQSISAFITKYNTSGEFLWMHLIDGLGTDDGIGITVDLYGNIYGTGYVGTGTISISGLTYTKTVNSANNGAFIVKFVDSTLPYMPTNIYASSYGSTEAIITFTPSALTDRSPVLYYTATSSPGGITVSGVSSPLIVSGLTTGISYTFNLTATSAVNTAIPIETNMITLTPDFYKPSWVEFIDGTGLDQGLDIITDFEGNIYCTGYVSTGTVTISGQTFTKPFNSANESAFIVKYNINGTFVWVQWIDGTLSEKSSGIATDASGNIYCTGYSNSSSVTISGEIFSKPNTGAGAFIVKYNTNGQHLWIQWIDSNGSDVGTKLIVDSTGNVYITGAINYGPITISGLHFAKPNNNSFDFDVFILKYTTNGTFTWIRWINGKSNSNDEGFDIANDSLGNIYVTGYVREGLVTISGIDYIKPFDAVANEGAFVAKFNSNGQHLWLQWIDGANSDKGNSIAADSSGNVYCTGSVGIGQVKINDVIYTTPSNDINQGAYIIKYNTNGTLLWVRWIDGNETDTGNGIAVDSAGNVYSTGQVGGRRININGIFYTKPINIGSYAGYIVKYNTNGDLLWLEWIDGTTSASYGMSITVDSNKHMYVTGHTYSTSIRVHTNTYIKPSASAGAYVLKLANQNINTATSPGIPIAITATAGNGQATVEFVPPISNGGSAILYYTATSSPGGFTVSGVNYSLVITGLTNGQAYTFTVTATNAAGTSSASEASVAVTPTAPITVPGIPRVVVGDASNARVTITFTEPISNGGSAILYYTATSSPGGFTVSGISSPLVITGLTNGQAYTFTVTSTNAAGTSSASEASVAVTPIAPSPAPEPNEETAVNIITSAISGAIVNKSIISQYVTSSFKTAETLYKELKLATKTQLTYSNSKYDDTIKTVIASLRTKGNVSRLDIPYADISNTFKSSQVSTNGNVAVFLPDFSNNVTPVIDATNVTISNYIKVEAPHNSTFRIVVSGISRSFTINLGEVDYVQDISTNEIFYLGDEITFGAITNKIVAFGSVLMQNIVNSSGTIIDPSQNNVNIYLPMTFELSGMDVQLFGQRYDMSGTIIKITDTLSLSSFYNISGYSWIKYKQDISENNFIASVKDLSAAAAIKTSIIDAVHLTDGSTYNVLNRGISKLDCSAVFIGAESTWQNYQNIQDFIISYFAEKILGHPGALAAISNDSSIRSSITEKFPITLDELSTISEDKLKIIIQQMINQDISRFNSADKDTYQPLVFRVGDKIMLQILLKENKYSLQNPTYAPSTVENGTITAESDSATAVATNINSIDYYLLEFTLA